MSCFDKDNYSLVYHPNFLRHNTVAFQIYGADAPGCQGVGVWGSGVILDTYCVSNNECTPNSQSLV